MKKCDSHLRAKNRMPDATAGLVIKVGGKPLRLLASSIFWPVYENQPTGAEAFRNLIPRLGMIKFTRDHSPSLQSFILPPSASPLLRAIDRYDSLKAIATAMLYYGSAMSYERWDYAQATFERAARTLCRISCVAPFATFGDEFVMNVLTAMTKRRHMPALNWQQPVKDLTAHYRTIIDFGRRMDVLLLNESYPQGRRIDELAALRLADEVGWNNLRNAFYKFHRDRAVTPLLEKLYLRTWQPPANIYA